MVRDENQYLSRNLTEVERLPHLTLEVILATGITWDGFRHYLGNKAVRMTRGVYVSAHYNPPLEADRSLVLGALNHSFSAGLSVDVRPGTLAFSACLNVDVKLFVRLLIQLQRPAINFLVRLLAASEERNVDRLGHRLALLPVSGPALSYLFERGREHLVKVSFGKMILNDEHVRALAITPCHELQLVLTWYSLPDIDACRNTFIQWLQSGGGPTGLNGCHSHILEDSLKGNSRLGILRLSSRWSLRYDDVRGCPIPRWL
jgi:hypothetical protein